MTFMSSTRSSKAETSEQHNTISKTRIKKRRTTVGSHSSPAPTRMRLRFFVAFPAICFLALIGSLEAHPLPDVPVRTTFGEDGLCTVKVEVDPRCFEADPENEGYLLKIQMEKLLIDADREALKARALNFVGQGIEFFFEPQGSFKPEFKWEFTTLGGAPLVNIDDPVMITGTWSTPIPAGLEGYAIRATKAMKFSVIFANTLRGQPVERTAVLFPGEKSFVLEMDGRTSSAATAPPEVTEQTLTTQNAAATPPSALSRYWRTAGVLVVALFCLWLAKRSQKV